MRLLSELCVGVCTLGRSTSMSNSQVGDVLHTDQSGVSSSKKWVWERPVRMRHHCGAGLPSHGDATAGQGLSRHH